MSIGDCPNWPGCGHRAQGQCDANMVGERPGVPIWTPLSGESIPNCLANSLKRAGELLRSTGNTGDSIDASRIEYLRLQILSGAYGVRVPADASAWWALVMGAAASIEDASNYLRDPDTKKQAEGAAKHYREAAQKLMAAAGVPEARTDHIRSVPGGAAFLRVAGNAGVPEVAAPDLRGLLEEVRQCFTRDDDLPNDLLPRIDAALDGVTGRDSQTFPGQVLLDGNEP
jgi:hypothetical protein